jgi:uncharacterized protein (DUF305 family)
MFRSTLRALALSGALACLPGTAPALAQGTSPAGQRYMDAMAKMQKDMSKDPSGDADVDFARMMIPHHEGALDMAKIELQHGKDAKLRLMAEKLIKAQSKEVGDLRDWLKKHGH